MQSDNNISVIPKEKLLEAANIKLSEGFEVLHCLTAQDNKESVELVYIFQSLKKHQMFTLKVELSLDDLVIESLSRLYKSADWLEREVFDLFGVKFINHPGLRRILNPDDWEGFPLRKDYTHPDIVSKPKF